MDEIRRDEKKDRCEAVCLEVVRAKNRVKNDKGKIARRNFRLGKRARHEKQPRLIRRGRIIIMG